MNSSVRVKKKLLVTVLVILVCVLFLFVQSGTFQDIKRLLEVANPSADLFFSYESDLVDVKVGEVTYRIPKAYFNTAYQLQEVQEGIPLNAVDIWASINDAMQPWPLSKSFYDKDKSGLVLITIRRGLVEPYLSEFPRENIRRMLERQRRNFPGRYNEVEVGIYKSSFHRFNEISKITTTNKLGLGSSFYLVPKNKTSRPVLIKCPIHGNQLHTLCTVSTVKYDFKIPHSKIELFSLYDQQVDKLVEALTIN